MHRHVLISASYDTDHAVPSRDITGIVRRGLSELDVDLTQIMTYTQSFHTAPMSVGLIEVWSNLTDEEREKIPAKLSIAIMVLLGVDTNGS